MSDAKCVTHPPVLARYSTAISEGLNPPPPTKNFSDRNLLLRQLWVSGGSLDHRFFHDEVERQKRLRERYKRLKPQYPDKPPEWWFDTHGIEIADMRGQA